MLILLQGVFVKGRNVNMPVLRIPVDVKTYEEFPPEMFELPLMQKNCADPPFAQEPGAGLPLLGKFARPVIL
jgi:hypothetical protein